MFFFLSDLNIFCLLFTTLASAPLTNQFYQRVVFFFSKRKIGVEFGRQKSQAEPCDHQSSVVEYKTLWCGCKYLCSLLSHRGWVLFFVFFLSVC